MPKYDFKCQMCNVTVEISVPITEDAVAGMCCGIPMQRDYTSPGIVFKGDGWAGKL